MAKNIEVEISGPLSKERNAELLDFFNKNGKLVSVKHRVLIDYSTFLGDGLRNREKDIRLRITNGKPEIIIKLGSWGSNCSRKEISVFAEKGSFDNLVQAYAALGYEKGMLCERTTSAFEYKGIEFALVAMPNDNYFYEAEIMSDDDGVEAARAKIEEVCKELGLSIYTNEEYLGYIEKLNKEVNEVFDFNKDYTEDYFENRYHFIAEAEK